MKQFCVICLTALLALAAGALPGQAENWSWVLSAGGTLEDTGISVGADALGNSYMAGTFSDSLTIGTTTLLSSGDTDIFVAKAGPAGNWLWAVQAGGLDAEIVSSLVIDGDNNVCLAGSYFGSAAFGGLGVFSNGYYDVFVAKLDPSGNWLWAASAGGADVPGETAEDIAVDAAGNLYITGSFLGTATFGTASVTSHGGYDMFAAKLDPNGGWLWAVHAGSLDADPEFPYLYGDYGQGIALDGSGNIYLTGGFMGTAYFGDLYLTSDGEQDAYVARLNPDGAWNWAAKGGGIHDDWGYKLALDSSNNIYVCGLFSTGAIFGDHILSAPNNANAEVFVAKLDPLAAWQWARQAGGENMITVNGIATDLQDKVLITGSFFGGSAFGTFYEASEGGSDIYLAKLDSTGEWQHLLTAGGEQNDQGMDLAVRNGSIWLTGAYLDSAHFGSLNVNGIGLGDAFLARITTGTPVQEDLQAPPLPFTLKQNRPNPFSPQTSIPLGIREGGKRYSLCVYDLRGRRVASLWDGPLSAGEHLLDWNGRDDDGQPLPAGVYFYRLSGASGFLTRKLILIR